VRFRLVVGSLAACLAVTSLAAWLFEMPFGEAAVLSPVIVAAVGAGAFVVLLWVRVALDPVLRRRRGVR